MASATKAKAARTKKTRSNKNAAHKKGTSSKQSNQAAAAIEGPLVLDEKIGIQCVSSLVDRLSVSLKSNAAIVIDAAAVTSVDIAALQVLVAFANSARSQSREVEWQCGDGALRQCAELSDLARHLWLDPVPVADDGLCPVF